MPTRERPRRAIRILGLSKTQQHMAKECDINNIMAKYQNTGLVTHIAKNAAAYQDLPPAIDYEEAHAILLRAETEFAALPSRVRLEFDNDPHAFLAFAENPENRDKMIELGLIPKPPKPTATPAETPTAPPAAGEDA